MDTVIFIRQLAQVYSDMAKKVNDYVNANAGNEEILPDAQAHILCDDVLRLTSYSNTFIRIADKLQLNNSTGCFDEIQKATDQLNGDIKEIGNINKIIAIAGSLIGVAAAILTPNNLSGIGSAAATLVKAIATPAGGEA